MKRKIARWEDYQPPTEWHAVLECGHRTPSEYDHFNDATKDGYDKVGEINCEDCARLAANLKALEDEAAEIRAKLSPSRGLPHE